MSPKEIAEAVGAALAVLWGVWTEIRLRNAQDENTQLRRAYNDTKIQDAIHAESDSDLHAELSKEIKS